MAESKSDYFSFELKAHSEKIEKFERLSNQWVIGLVGMAFVLRWSPRLNNSHRAALLRDTRPIFM